MERVCFSLVLLWSIASTTGNQFHYLMVPRKAFLTVNLVDMRCPSQLNVLLGNPVAKPVNPAIAAGRKLLGIPDGQPFLMEDTELVATLASEEALEADTTRHLLGKPAVLPGAPTLSAWRENSRKAAVEATEEICSGAPDDRGPGIIFALHLDVDIPVHTPGPPGMEAPATQATAQATATQGSDGVREVKMAETGAAHAETSPQEKLPVGSTAVHEDRLVSEGDAEPVILRDDGPPVGIVVALMLMIAVCGGVGCMYCLVKGDDERYKTAKLENEALKAKLASLRNSVNTE